MQQSASPQPPDPEPTQPADRNDDLQRIIDQLARTGKGRPVADLLADLEARLQEAGLRPMPDSWLQAVAESAAAGNPYVLSKETRRHTSVPPAQTPAPPYGVS
jgi:phage-related baseplate assembly protein